MSALLSAAEQWEQAAEELSRKATIDKRAGVFTGVTHPAERAAELYRKTAHSIRLEDQTGEPHCLCHMAPLKDCPFRQQGRVLIR